MTAPIRLLHLEDDAGNAELVRRTLQGAGPPCEIVWVRTMEDFQSLLRQRTFDLVLLDHELAGHGGLEALQHVRATQPDLPAIIVSDGMSEEEAVDCVKAGATDYVLKQRLHRLCTSVPRALTETRERAALRRAEEDIRAWNAELEERVRSRTAELETANSFLNSVIQHIPHGVIVKDAAELRFVRLNRSVERLLGRSEQELLGKSAYDINPTRAEAEFITARDREALALGREVDVPAATLHSPTGEERILHMKKIPILDDSGQPRYILTIAEDVTEKVKKEREVERLNAALAQRTTEVEAANRAKSTFLATMSHEIRTPMNGMLGMLELLSLTQLDAEQRETLGLVRASSKSLLRIIDDILDFSKIEAGKLDIRPEVVSIRQVIEEVQSIYLGNASSKGLVVRRIVDPRISPALRVDPVRLRQILNNFVSNAIKFTPSGSIEIHAQFVGRADGQESLLFVVKDTGVGISQEDQRRLFQPFSQAFGDEARRSSGGAGLGLVISRQLAQMMGGSISMESAPGHGTTMTLSLTLPIAEPVTDGDSAGARVPPPTTPARRAAPGLVQAETEGTLMLLVDDHPVNRMLLLRQVQTLGYAAQTAEQGVQALEMWKSGRFGLVITDCHMPQMDGYELARSIRRLESAEERKRIPIIACTANALQGEAEACLAAGMDDCLVKPVELSQLTEKLDRWLPLPPQPAAPPAAAAPGPDTALAAPIDQSFLMKNCGGYAAMVHEVLAAFRQTCEEDAAGLEKAVAADDTARVTHFAHRMGGASKMVGALGFAAACEHIERASRAGDWNAVMAGMPAFEQERMRLAAYFESGKQTT